MGVSEVGAGGAERAMDGEERVVVANPWGQLRRFTPARIALGRTGTSQPTDAHLAFQLAHARARKAVHQELDAEQLEARLSRSGRSVLRLESAASSRPVYLQRPDLGRRLRADSRERLEAWAAKSGEQAGRPAPEIVFVIGDGLSALAIDENAEPFLGVMLPALEADGWDIGPLVVVRQARVAIGDEVGEVLGAAFVAVLIGERPGLSSPDSMGLYVTKAPRRGLTDEARNCISNIRRDGLGHAEAAWKLGWLLTEARRRGFTGVHLKDEAAAATNALSGPGRSFLAP